ncbi:integrase-like protein [Solirubrobacter pauli]|uniref:Integrase-like protein n=1 Tax=Solirubrobacter pauli TaxID=166793 RepID=A0A660L915_9ACTN|nr:site-specific integrase [Solirubrobacter pauli]RKQ90876.1 integrase-like protein [Solirubrobacter pauli]
MSSADDGPIAPELNPALVERIAHRVLLRLVSDSRGDDFQLLTVAQVARRLQVHSSWVYANARQLGALRLGTGPKAPLRFDPRRVALAVGDPSLPAAGPSSARRRPEPPALRRLPSLPTPARGHQSAASTGPSTGAAETRCGRRPTGQVRKTWRKRDEQWRFALRIWWQGERVWVPLGLEADGWNDYRAKLELENVTREIAAGVWRPPTPQPLDPGDRNPIFREFATFWLDEKQPDLERSTYDDYRNLLTNHVLPAFHDKRLSEINYEAINAYRTARLREGARRKRASEAGVPLHGRPGRPLRPFGARQVNASVRLLAQILDRAVRSERFDLEHHRARERELKVKREKPVYRRFLEVDELLDVLDAALEIDQRSSPETLELGKTVRHLREIERLPWTRIAATIGRAESTTIWLSRQTAGGRRARRAMIATLGLSGLRAHEVADLRRRHLDFTHGRIVIADGKTYGSVREVHMSPFLREELLVYVAEVGQTGADELVFPTRRGTPHSRQNLNRRVLAPAVARATQARATRGDAVLPPAITPHTLRRTFVTLSAQAGRSPSWIQAQIGHADMTTMQRYYMQASHSETQPRMKRLVEYVLDEAGMTNQAHAPTGEARQTLLLPDDPAAPGI